MAVHPINRSKLSSAGVPAKRRRAFSLAKRSSDSPIGSTCIEAINSSKFCVRRVSPCLLPNSAPYFSSATVFRRYNNSQYQLGLSSYPHRIYHAAGRCKCLCQADTFPYSQNAVMSSLNFLSILTSAAKQSASILSSSFHTP